MKAPRKLFELAGAEDNRCFSPFCWRIRLALLHKELPFETVPWRFAEKEAIAASGQGKVPVLIDGDRIVHDSWAIAEYLEATYPDHPHLFSDAQSKALARFVTNWVEKVLHSNAARLVLLDVYNHLHDKDKDYFRHTREAAFGTSLEAVVADREQHLQSWRQGLSPLRATLAHQPYISGEAPAWADYVVLSAFQWIRSISPCPALEPSDPVWEWRSRLLNRFEGALSQARVYPLEASV
jgi:glutathione S-transferase